MKIDGGGGVQPSPSCQPSVDEKGSLGSAPAPDGGIGVPEGLGKKDPCKGYFFPMRKKKHQLFGRPTTSGFSLSKSLMATVAGVPPSSFQWSVGIPFSVLSLSPPKFY